MKRHILAVMSVVVSLAAALSFGNQPAQAAASSVSISGNCGVVTVIVSLNNQSIVISGGGRSSGQIGPITASGAIGFNFKPPLPGGTTITVTIVGTSISASFTCSSGGSGGANCQNPDPDGRLNAVCVDAAQSAALYCSSDKGGMVILRVQQSIGNFAFNVSQQELDRVPAMPKVNTLIKQSMGIQLWRLTTGELQFNTPNGEAYTFGLPANGPVTFNQICMGQVSWYHPLEK